MYHGSGLGSQFSPTDGRAKLTTKLTTCCVPFEILFIWVSELNSWKNNNCENHDADVASFEMHVKRTDSSLPTGESNRHRHHGHTDIDK